VGRLSTRDSKGCKGCLRLAENAMDNLSIQVKPTLSTGTPLPLPPICREVSTIWGAGRKPAQYTSAPHRKLPEFGPLQKTKIKNLTSIVLWGILLTEDRISSKAHIVWVSLTTISK